jgi:hypothetical protein
VIALAGHHIGHSSAMAPVPQGVQLDRSHVGAGDFNTRGTARSLPVSEVLSALPQRFGDAPARVDLIRGLGTPQSGARMLVLLT